MNKRYNNCEIDILNIIIGNKGYGKTYYELLKIIKKLNNELTSLQEENKILKELNVCVGCTNNPNYKQRNEKAVDYIIDNCVLCDEWKDLGFCNFIPTGRIKYKQLSKTKIKHLLNILKGDKR